MKLLWKPRPVRTFISLFLFGAFLAACGGVDEAPDYEPLRFSVEGEELLASGVIDATTLTQFREVTAANDGLERLLLLWVPGSADDEANLELARSVRALGLATEVPPGGLVASGGTDLFLAGRERTIAPDACIGVHSWGDGDGFEGAELPRGDPEHRPYLLYYEDMGIDPSFYWFTLEAAGADSIHWMSPDEQSRFGMATGVASHQDRQASPSQHECDARLPE